MDRKLTLIFLADIFLFILDRLTKYLALKLPPAGVFLGDLFKWKLYYNPDLAFSIPFGNSLAIVLSLIILVFLSYYFFLFLRRSWLVMSGLGLIILGAASNLIDRFKFGGVIDFIDFSFFPAFNLSDCYIIIGALILVFSFKKVSEAGIINKEKI